VGRRGHRRIYVVGHRKSECRAADVGMRLQRALCSHIGEGGALISRTVDHPGQFSVGVNILGHPSQQCVCPSVCTTVITTSCLIPSKLVWSSA
jgi:hypothetical protein